MTISQAQLRTLNLLDKKPAHRVYRSNRAYDYNWVHDDTHISLTPTLHRLFSSGYAMLSPDNRNVAVLTEKGREVVAVRGGC
jgi:DNA-binding PadR family transcriptional regulator